MTEFENRGESAPGVQGVESSGAKYSEPGFQEEEYAYRALSRPAVISLILGVLSFSALPLAGLLVLPAIGLVLGLLGLRAIRRYPEELLGGWVATSGIVLNGLLLVGGVSLHSLIYIYEVPEGAQRISFYELQPDKNTPELPVPPAALELNGKQIFIKGYLFPDGQQANIKQFVLVPDMGTCCFGGQPKLTDMIQVTLRDPLRVEYSYVRRRLAGILKVDTRLKPVSGVQGVYYQLDADYVK